MKIVLYFILPLVLVSCCLGNRKCPEDYRSARFRIISSVNGYDLVFGPSKIYNKDSIKFYSLNGADTVIHHYGAGPNPNPGQDSLLFVQFDYRKINTVYVRINNIDTDTLNLRYDIVNSTCCGEHSEVTPVYYNNMQLENGSGGITIIKK